MGREREHKKNQVKGKLEVSYQRSIKETLTTKLVREQEEKLRVEHKRGIRREEDTIWGIPETI